MTDAFSDSAVEWCTYLVGQFELAVEGLAPSKTIAASWLNPAGFVFVCRNLPRHRFSYGAGDRQNHFCARSFPTSAYVVQL